MTTTTNRASRRAEQSPKRQSGENPQLNPTSNPRDMLPTRRVVPSPSDTLPPDNSLVLVPDSTAPPLAPDVWVPEGTVCAELGLTSMSLWRYDRDAKMIALGWPLPIKMNRRKFRSRRALDAFKANLAALALKQRDALLRAAELRKQTRVSAGRLSGVAQKINMPRRGFSLRRRRPPPRDRRGLSRCKAISANFLRWMDY